MTEIECYTVRLVKAQNWSIELKEKVIAGYKYNTELGTIIDLINYAINEKTQYPKRGLQ